MWERQHSSSLSVFLNCPLEFASDSWGRTIRSHLPSEPCRPTCPVGSPELAGALGFGWGPKGKTLQTSSPQACLGGWGQGWGATGRFSPAWPCLAAPLLALLPQAQSPEQHLPLVAAHPPAPVAACDRGTITRACSPQVHQPSRPPQDLRVLVEEAEPLTPLLSSITL